MCGRAHKGHSSARPPDSVQRPEIRWLAAWKVSSQPCAFFGNPPGTSHNASGSSPCGVRRNSHRIPSSGPAVEGVQRRAIGVETRRLYSFTVAEISQPPVLERFHIPGSRLVPGTAEHPQKLQPHHQCVGIPSPRRRTPTGHRPGPEEQVDPRIRVAGRLQHDRCPVPCTVPRCPLVYSPEPGKLVNIDLRKHRGEVVELHRPAPQSIRHHSLQSGLDPTTLETLEKLRALLRLRHPAGPDDGL